MEQGTDVWWPAKVVFAQAAADPLLSPWAQMGAFGLLLILAGWVGKILLPGKDAALEKKDGQYKELLDAKDKQIAAKDEQTLAILKSGMAARDKDVEKFQAALEKVGDKFQVAMLRFEADHDKRDDAANVRVQKLIDAIVLDGKESRDHMRREWETHAELCKMERNQREQDHAEMKDLLLKLVAREEDAHANPGR